MFCQFDAIEDKWLENLEIKDVILEMADDLYNDCDISEFEEKRDPDWERKYIYGKWKD